MPANTVSIALLRPVSAKATDDNIEIVRTANRPGLILFIV
jgi:hypothetical protein